MTSYTFVDDSAFCHWIFYITILSLHCSKEGISLNPLKCHLKCLLPQQRIENITIRATRWRTSSGDTLATGGQNNIFEICRVKTVDYMGVHYITG